MLLSAMKLIAVMLQESRQHSAKPKCTRRRLPLIRRG
jgi:hypothetical protein